VIQEVTMARSEWKWKPVRKQVKVGTRNVHAYIWTVRDTPTSVPRMTSWGWRLWVWGRNETRGTERIDLPGKWDIKRRYR
jgi:hypothetical protein